MMTTSEIQCFLEEIIELAKTHGVNSKAKIREKAEALLDKLRG